MLFVILLFYGVGLLMGIPEIIMIGAVFAVLPLVWSYGEISALRLRNEEESEYSAIRNKFGSGFDAVKAVLSYFIILLVLVVTEVLFNLLGWIPQIGFSFMGLALNINTLASLLLLFVFVILIFSKLIMPAHVVFNRDFSASLIGSINFLGVIGRRFLRYLVSFVPNLFFGSLVLIIPALLVFLSVVISLNLKNSLLDSRIEILSQRESVLTGNEKYKCRKDLERVRFYKSFPENVLSEFKDMKTLRRDVRNLELNIEQGEKEISTLSDGFAEGIDSLNRKIENIKNQPMADSSSAYNIINLQELKKSRLESFARWKADADEGIIKMKTDLSDKNGMLIQLPLVFILTIIWASLFAGIIMTFLISYLGNVFFELYNLKEDGKPIYLNEVATEMKVKDRNQPLLGFTLIIILGVILSFYSEIERLIINLGS